MKRSVSLAALLALAAAFAGCGRRPAHDAAAMPERKLATAKVEGIQAPAILEVDGVVVGEAEVILASRLAAPVVDVRAIPGANVRAGEVLVRLAGRESDAAVASARAAVAAARTAYETASRNRARFERLEGRGAAAAIELDRAKQEEAASASAAASAEASLARAETDRSQSVLAAPFDAVVVEKMVSAGDLAAPGRPLVRLASTRGRRVEAAPGEEDAARLTVGRSIPVVLGENVVEGRIVEIVGAVDPATRRRIVRLGLPEGVEPAVGSFARLQLPGPSARRLVVPARAVVERGGLEIAWTVEPDGRVALRYVRTGGTVGEGRLEVRSGLEAGERVVIDPPDDLAAGTRAAS